jgi:hypothetical protein
LFVTLGQQRNLKWAHLRFVPQHEFVLFCVHAGFWADVVLQQLGQRFEVKVDS